MLDTILVVGYRAMNETDKHSYFYRGYILVGERIIKI